MSPVLGMLAYLETADYSIREEMVSVSRVTRPLIFFLAL